MAILSKYPIKEEGYIDFPNSNNGAMYVDIDIKGEVVRVYNIHLQSFKVPIGFYDFSEARSYNSIISRVQKAERIRKKQATLMKDHIENFKGKIILCGDFNTTQFSSPYNLLKGSKKDSFIEAGNGLGSTFSLYGYPFRLDYILADESFNVLSHENFELNLSDHEPILVELGMD
jgi:endonuclease/exonuclease/phosphatase family metal-dependent hydrolase